MSTKTANEFDYNLNIDEFDKILDEIEQDEVEHKMSNKIEQKIPENVNWDNIITQLQVKNITFIKNLISSREMDVNNRNPKDGKTLLIHSVIIGDIELVKVICNFGGDISIKDDEGFDALDYAKRYGRYKITSLVYYKTLSGSLGNDLKLLFEAVA
eukprot:301386_1